MLSLSLKCLFGEDKSWWSKIFDNGSRSHRNERVGGAQKVKSKDPIPFILITFMGDLVSLLHNYDRLKQQFRSSETSEMSINSR